MHDEKLAQLFAVRGRNQGDLEAEEERADDPSEQRTVSHRCLFLFIPLLLAVDERLQGETMDFHTIQDIVTCTDASEEFTVDIMLVAVVGNVCHVNVEDRSRGDCLLGFAEMIDWNRRSRCPEARRKERSSSGRPSKDEDYR
jgi:hypothetical protein